MEIVHAATCKQKWHVLNHEQREKILNVCNQTTNVDSKELTDLQWKDILCILSPLLFLATNYYNWDEERVCLSTEPI